MNTASVLTHDRHLPKEFKDQPLNFFICNYVMIYKFMLVI